MRNVLVVCENLKINQSSAGIGRSKLIKLLHESGYSITVLTENNFNYPITWLPEGVIVKKFDIPVFKKSFIDHIPKIKAIPSYLTGFSKPFRKTLEEYKKVISIELSSQKFDLIYALGSGNAFAPHFALAEMNLAIPFFVNIHDPFPMHLYPEPYKKPKTWVNTILEKKFKIVLDKAKGISFPSELLMNDMARTFSIIKSKGFVIPHIGTSLNNLPAEDSDTNESLDPSKINILHAGTLLGPRNPKFLLQAISELNQENAGFLDKIAFTFIGRVNKALTDIVSSSKLENVRFLTSRMSYQKSLDFIEQSDASLVIEAISEFSPFLPGKVADIAFAEKPIIDLSPKKSEVRRLLGDLYPYQSKLDDVAAIKVVLNQFYNDYKNDTIDSTVILNIKNYVSIEHNSKVIKEYLK